MMHQVAPACRVRLAVLVLGWMRLLSAQLVMPELKPYDCDAEADIWEWAWTPDWKAWCCQHEQKGCPPTTTVPTTLTATATDTATYTDTVTQTKTQSVTTTSDTTTVSYTRTVANTETHSTTWTDTKTQTQTQTRTATATVLAETTAVTTAKATEVTTVRAEKAQAFVEPLSKPHLRRVKPETTSSTVATTTAATKSASTEALVVPSAEVQTTTGADLGCNSECVILGESATCQSRITWVETHQTQHESAPCPAAHVVVMSQCASCGVCMFKDVNCASSQGVSKSLGEHTFMYKYLQEPAGAVEVQAKPQIFASTNLVCFSIVPLAIVVGMVLHHRQWRRRELAPLNTELVVPMAEE